MPEIKLKKRYKYVGDIYPKLLEIGFDNETAQNFLNDIKDADVEPKSEVDRLTQELDDLAEEHSDLIVEKDQLYDTAVNQREVIKTLNDKIDFLRKTIKDNAQKALKTTLEETEKARCKAIQDILSLIDNKIRNEVEMYNGFHSLRNSKTLCQERVNALNDMKFIINYQFRVTPLMTRQCPNCKYFVGCEAACGGVPCELYDEGVTNAE